MLIAPGRKHAVILLEKQKDRWTILNNKWPQSEEPEYFYLNDQEFLERLEDDFPVAQVKQENPRPINWSPIFEQSLRDLEKYEYNLLNDLKKEKTQKEHIEARDPLYRALLLDGLTMMELLGKKEMLTSLKALQSKYMDALRSPDSFALSHYLPPDDVQAVIRGWQELIREKLMRANR